MTQVVDLPFVTEDTEIDKKVHRTYDYGRFRFLNDNRQVYNVHVRRIMKLIEESDLTHLTPITVNSKLEVIDGQHRLLACQKLHKPVYYEIVDTLTSDDLPTLNRGTMNWSLDDYLRHYKARGIESYKNISEIVEHTEFSVSSILWWLGDAKTQNAAFKEGSFTYTDSPVFRENVYKASDVLALLKQRGFLTAKGNGGKGFIQALKRLLEKPFVSYKRLIKRFAEAPVTKMRAISTIPLAMGFLVDTYNYKSHAENRLIVISNGNVCDVLQLNKPLDEAMAESSHA